MSSPYANLGEAAFWRASVAERHPYDLSLPMREPLLRPQDRIATAGSCFAQHIGKQLKRRGARYVDLEPLPGAIPPEEAARFGYGLFSCRYGNVYTTRQLLQLLREAIGERSPSEQVWTKGGRYYDALRPSVDPVGHDSAADILHLRRAHLARVKQLLTSIDVFVFTMGLTETWAARSDGTVYPSAPGTLAGEWDATKYEFLNLRYTDVMSDLRAALDIMRAANPALRVILTVSPVPLKATASGEHVLIANSQSKSTLRAVAGDLAADDPRVSYFPSYELIASHSMRAMFFDPDLRSVNAGGVDFVMAKFFDEGSTSSAPRGISAVPMTQPPPSSHLDLVCDEEANDPDE